MNIKSIEHIAINTLDFQKSIDFYCGILGFRLLQTVDCGDFNITYIELPNQARLELFDYHGKSMNKLIEESDVGLRHLAFNVEDVASCEKILSAAGVEITLSTCDLINLEARVLLFLDPNGIVIEFCEKLSIIS